MAILIDIKWECISPAIGVASGILKIKDIKHYVTSNISTDVKILLECKCTVKHGSKGYTALDDKGYSSKIFKEYEEQIDLMMSSYFAGLLLTKNQFHWVPSTFKEKE